MDSNMIGLAYPVHIALIVILRHTDGTLWSRLHHTLRDDVITLFLIAARPQYQGSNHDRKGYCNSFHLTI